MHISIQQMLYKSDFVVLIRCPLLHKCVVFLNLVWYLDFIYLSKGTCYNLRALNASISFVMLPRNRYLPQTVAEENYKPTVTNCLWVLSRNDADRRMSC